MAEVGFTLSSEEFGPQLLVDLAAKAEAAGFSFLGLSDHYHPWVSAQGQSPFSWTVLGGISQVTKEVDVLLRVICPIIRYHPAIVAQAAATTAALMDGRFLLGLGTGENINEHVVGVGWPTIKVRQEMLKEAVGIIQALWEGDATSVYGRYFTVEDAKIYTLPQKLPPIIISAFGPRSARLAGEIGDGLVSLAPQKSLLDTFEQAGGKSRPKYCQIHVCYDTDKEQAKQTVLEQWPNSGLPGQLSSELRLPVYFEQAAGLLDKESAAKNVVCGDDPEEFIAEFEKFKQTGYDHVYFHQIGEKQEEFIDFAADRLLPNLS